MPYTRTDRGWGDIPRGQKLEQVQFLSVPEGVLFVFDQGMVRARNDDAGRFFLSYYPGNVPECWDVGVVYSERGYIVAQLIMQLEQK